MLAVLLLVVATGTDASRSLHADADPYTNLCLDTSDNSTVPQGTISKCAQSGGTKVCSKDAKWVLVGGECSDWDMALQKVPCDFVGCREPNYRHYSGPHPARPLDKSFYEQCLITPTPGLKVRQGTLSTCRSDAGKTGRMVCRQHGCWTVVSGTCTDKEQAITREKDGTYHGCRSGGQP
jgi:hypothetical protein